MKQGTSILAIFVVFSVLAFGSGYALRSVGAAAEQSQPAQQQVRSSESEDAGTGGWGVPLAIALSVGVSCISAGYAVGRVGSAAIGAISEKPELFGRSLIFVGLAEGIAIYGLLIAILLWTRM